MSEPGSEEYGRWQASQIVYERVMADFEAQKLTSRGKGDIPYIVTAPQQAFAIAKNMAKRAARRYVHDPNPPLVAAKQIAVE
ncbi:hypothetical protein HDU88_008417 [Geranomyces variabilis]|nr:hypothetical protein HDU88_008417 [Geranomyces variabilis]